MKIMKNITIIAFLLFGNILFSNIHHHDHSHEFEMHECEECISIQNSDNCVLDFSSIVFFVINSSQLQILDFSAIDINSDKRYNSRAPPIS